MVPFPRMLEKHHLESLTIAEASMGTLNGLMYVANALR